jgi:predicted RNase H-like HicB family nuclease
MARYNPLMRNEFTAIVERDGDLFIAYCPELPGANGQGPTKDAMRETVIVDRRGQI